MMVTCYLLFVYSGEGGPRPKQREPAGDREVLPSATSEPIDAVGAAGTADTVERDRTNPAPADVQFVESYSIVGQATTDTKHFVVGLRGRR